MEGNVATAEQCKEFVKNVKDLEISCYEQNLLINKLTARLNQARQRLSSISNEKIEPVGNPPVKKEASLSGIFLSGICGAIFGGLLGFIWRIIRVIFTSLKLSDPFMPSVCWGAVIFFWIAIILDLFTYLSDKSPDAITKYQEARTEYEKKVKKHEQKLAVHNENISKQQAQISLLENSLIQCKAKYSETQKLLAKYYSLNYIYPKYQGIVPICTIYEYLESGRCDSLAGAAGAYNLYETELRMNIIIGKLDNIINRLDDIAENQRLLASEIRNCHSQLVTLLNSVDSSVQSIQESAALTEYHSRITSANTDYLVWMDFFRNSVL